MLNMDKRSYMIYHVRIFLFFGAPKNCAFGKTLKICLNDLTPWVELNWVRSHAGVTCWQRAVGRNDKGDRFNVRAFLRAKRRCQLIVRLKAIKYKEDIFCDLYSYINLLSWFQLVPTLWPLTSVISDCCYQPFVMILQFELLLAFGLIAFVLKSIFYFWYCSHWPLSTSSPRRNLFHS